MWNLLSHRHKKIVCSCNVNKSLRSTALGTTLENLLERISIQHMMKGFGNSLYLLHSSHKIIHQVISFSFSELEAAPLDSLRSRHSARKRLPCSCLFPSWHCSCIFAWFYYEEYIIRSVRWCLISGRRSDSVQNNLQPWLVKTYN